MVARKPPCTAAAGPLGRNCVVTQRAEERFRTGDEESLREDLAHLRAAAIAMRSEEAEIRERVLQAERESHAKDKLLQELLAAAKPGRGVPGEALDQLREDLQMLLHVKTQNYEARIRLDEKDQKLLTIQHELKTTQANGRLEDEISAAKADAKNKAKEWRNAIASNANVPNVPAAQIAKLRTQIEDILSDIALSQNEVTRKQRQWSEQEDERARCEREVQNHEKQIQQLQESRVCCDSQIQECRTCLIDVARTTAERERLRAEIEKLTLNVQNLRHEIASREVQLSIAEKTAVQLSIHPNLLKPGFTPLVQRGADGAAEMLIWRLRHSLAEGQFSGLGLLLAEDSVGDGRVSAQELSRAFRRINLPRSDPAAVDDLFLNVNESLLADGRMSILDFILSLPLQQQPQGPPEASLERAILGVARACKRRGKSEQEIRSILADFVSAPAISVEIACTKFLANDIGISQDFAASFARGLEVYRTLLLRRLPSWRTFGEASKAAIIIRFLQVAAEQRDVMLPRLNNARLEYNEFLTICSGFRAGPPLADLEEVGFLAEIPPGSLTDPPIVDGMRLARAIEPGGFAKEFELLAEVPVPKAKAFFLAPVIEQERGPTCPSSHVASQAASAADVTDAPVEVAEIQGTSLPEPLAEPMAEPTDEASEVDGRSPCLPEPPDQTKKASPSDCDEDQDSYEDDCEDYEDDLEADDGEENDGSASDDEN